MTRSGALAYYMAAWIIGAVFMSLAVWMRDPSGASVTQFSPPTGFGVLLFCFYGLIYGAAPALAGAFLLRTIASLACWETPAPWVAAGTLVTVLEMLGLGIWGRTLAASRQIPSRILSLITFGPKTVLDGGWWLAIPVGAATSFILYRVHRAFRQGSTAATAASDKHNARS
jgi:hypothetical protein